ncbi:hypothetical protein ACH5RR_001149 [Cinchona calisaya]|uniref:Uncharacterized protein n=1 Tax=Cinchona calisaya TaxID=153742 RepID=A0ABD3B3D5_9GENT
MRDGVKVDHDTNNIKLTILEFQSNLDLMFISNGKRSHYGNNCPNKNALFMHGNEVVSEANEDEDDSMLLLEGHSNDEEEQRIFLRYQPRGYCGHFTVRPRTTKMSLTLIWPCQDLLNLPCKNSRISFPKRFPWLVTYQRY